MADTTPTKSDLLSGDIDFVKDLERQSNTEIKKLRAHERFDREVTVIVQHANSSEMLKFKMKGKTRDISGGGCGAVFPIPVTVGDFFRIALEGEGLDIPLTFARCMRCQLVREDAYEVGFQFLGDLELPDLSSASDLLA